MLTRLGDTSAGSRDGESGLVAVRGGCQKLDERGSKRPAPGQMMSSRGNVSRPREKSDESCGQERTSVGWKTADGCCPDEEEEEAREEDGECGYSAMSFSASGRRARSPIMTEQPRDRSSRANARLMPR